MEKDNELEEDFVRVNEYIKQCNFFEAAEIIATYVYILTDNRKKDFNEFKTDLSLFLKELPEGFVKFAAFKHLIEELARMADEGKYMDPRSVQN